ncbi:MAG: methyltransferase domain-containing protein [Cytophagaceae bacterium]|nr:methyltransferase domain-containing protein [Cytophagaceae bacterium]
MKTKQTDFWSGHFGREYTDRNPQNVNELEQLFFNSYGFKRTEINNEFIGTLSKEIKILEVGCNIGLQLAALQTMGFKNLYGIELQPYAFEKSKEITQGINIIQGSGFDIPFRDNYFDVVYTNGVLIHIAPADLPNIMKEMIRCSKKYIWGFEYYSPEVKEISYRGNQGFMWKADYCSIFLDQVPNLKVVKKKLYPYILESEKGNEDIGFLIEKT